MNRQFPGTRALMIFEAAARHLNFSRAAEEIGLTPAAVSYQIKEIEDQTGLVLFSRTSRTMVLTPSGRLMHEAAIDALTVLRAALGRARKLSRNENILRVTADPVFAGRWLMPRVDDFRRVYPAIDLRFDVSNVLRDFDSDDIDVGIRFGAGNYPGLAAHRLFDTIVVPVCSPEMLRKGPPLNKPEDLLGRRLAHIEWSRPGMVWPNWRMWMLAAGVEGFDPNDVVLFGESSQLIPASLAGSVIALVDAEMIADDLAAGRLVRLFDLSLKVQADIGYFLVYPQASANNPHIVAFRNWILSEAGKSDSSAL